jgi:hypothetical protein
MINARSVVISILGAVLSATPLIRAQDLKPSGSAAIQELALQPQPFLAGFTFQADSIPLPPAQAPDLSRYREFRLGMTLPAVAKQTAMELSDVTVIHQRPVLIQELNWRLPPSEDSPSGADPVEDVTFAFYNGELFGMAVHYEQGRTEGLTENDLVKAISVTYGSATRPAGKSMVVSSPIVDSIIMKVVARWENAQYLISLLSFTDQPGFELIVSSKPMDVLAQAASAKAVRLEEQEAPQREIARQKQQDDDDRALLAKARQANQAAFRP